MHATTLTRWAGAAVALALAACGQVVPATDAAGGGDDVDAAADAALPTTDAPPPIDAATATIDGPAALIDAGAGVTVTIAHGGTGAGAVISNPAGLDCGAACVATFPSNAPIKLVAVPAPGSLFEGWDTALCDSTAMCELTLTAPITITAKFTLAP